MLLDHIKTIPDHRRGQGKLFDLPHVLLFSILAIASGADSYRKMAIYIQENFETLKKHYDLSWKRPPNYNSIRHIIHSMDFDEVEKAFRAYSQEVRKKTKKYTVISIDGKALKGSFDTVEDERFKQILSAFSPTDNLIIAHAKIGVSKDNEINAARKMMEQIKIPHTLYTLDALHTQKKRLKP